MDVLNGILSGFTQAEIAELENQFQQLSEESLDEGFCQKIAKGFNCSKSRAGKPEINWEKVQEWFENRQKEPPTNTSTYDASKELTLVSETPLLSTAPDIPQVSSGLNIMELSELNFEAKSSKDDAWYDVGAFLTFRVTSTGELEVRIRFSGFTNEEDEWVNLKTGVRERSIPLEASECQRIKVGDLVLCFQERVDRSIYCDAHVLEIERRLHDLRGCRCVFMVRYDHDSTEDKVLLKRLCCRPENCKFKAQMRLG